MSVGTAETGSFGETASAAAVAGSETIHAGDTSRFRDKAGHLVTITYFYPDLLTLNPKA